MSPPDSIDARGRTAADADTGTETIVPPADPPSSFGETLPATGLKPAVRAATVPPPAAVVAGPSERRAARAFAVVALAGAAGLSGLAGWLLGAAGRDAARLAAGTQASAQTQRLAQAASQALAGTPSAFAELRPDAQTLAQSVRALHDGMGDVPAALTAAREGLAALGPPVDRLDRQAALLLAQQPALAQAHGALRTLTAQAEALVEAALRPPAGATAAETAAAGRLALALHRLDRPVADWRAGGTAAPQAVARIGPALAALREVAQTVPGEAGGLPPVVPAAAATQPAPTLPERIASLRAAADVLERSLPALATAARVQAAIAADAEAVRQGLQAVQPRLAAGTGPLPRALLILCLILLAIGAAGGLRSLGRERSRRSASVEEEQLAAERRERDDRRRNDADQTAIVRLMNELQAVAEGDLTRQATVTEDITGAIADSINHTVEELRTLVRHVQATAARVTDTTGQVEATSTALLAASDEQLREIRDTGEAVLRMAGRIHDVSAQAAGTVQVAEQSRRAASSGRGAVQDTIGGMQAIRDQIQETSKRIKRLGESTQEIGEITELISGITEQTNVLALNAAIQAASAGEAGRGFSVVAEEVQRLAERSADATRQIAALVRTIQTDAQDAAGAMERSTQGVVAGTRLSDAAGAALDEIDRVTHRLADFVAHVARQAADEARSADVVATHIQHIFAVTEQTGDGTRSTVQRVRELARTAEALRQSVARFRIA